LANSKIMPAADQRIRFALEAVEKIVCTYVGGPIRTRGEADCAMDQAIQETQKTMFEAFKFVERAIPRVQKFRNKKTRAKHLNDLNMMMHLLEEAETQLATVASVCQDFAQRLLPQEVMEMRRNLSDAPPTADRLDASADEPAQVAIGEGTATVPAAAATSAAAVPACDSVAAQECAAAELAHRGQTTAARPAAVATACEGASEYEDVARNLNDYFGSFPKCFVLLFYIVTGGEDWSQFYRALAEMNEYSWVYKWWLVAYLVIMVFGVLNVITAIFVECSLSKAQADRDLSLATQ